MIADHFALPLAHTSGQLLRTSGILKFALQLEHAGGCCAEGAALVAEEQELVVLVVRVVSALLHEAEAGAAGVQVREEEDDFLAVGEGVVEEAEGVRELGTGLLDRGPACALPLREPLLREGVQRFVCGGRSVAAGNAEIMHELLECEDDLPLDAPRAVAEEVRLLPARELGDHRVVIRCKHWHKILTVAELLQLGEDGALDVHLLAIGAEALAEGVGEEADEGELLVERGAYEGTEVGRTLAGENLRDVIARAVLLIEGVVGREVARHLRVLEVLEDELARDREAHLLVNRHDAAQVFPAAGGDELLPGEVSLHDIEVLLLDVEVGEDRAVDAHLVGVALPGVDIRGDVEALHTVEGHDVEVAHGAVVLRRVAGGDDHEAVRDLMGAEGLVLQELQHHRGEGLGHAVDLVEEEDAFVDAGALDLLIDCGDDLGHGVLGDGVLLAAEIALRDEREADRGLARVVRDGVRHEVDAQLGRDLLHDGGLADARRAHEEHRALLLDRDPVGAGLVLQEIGADRVDDFLFCFDDVHFYAFRVSMCR